MNLPTELYLDFLYHLLRYTITRLISTEGEDLLSRNRNDRLSFGIFNLHCRRGSGKQQQKLRIKARCGVRGYDLNSRFDQIYFFVVFRTRFVIQKIYVEVGALVAVH